MGQQVVFSARRVLQLCVFFAGLAGIVTEYTLSTIASYLLGDTIFQWALTISFFLFAMGIGSRWTRYIDSHETTWFVVIESCLSLAVGLCVPVVYGLAPWPERLPWVLYSWTVLIGALIGMEIPLVIRINSKYEKLSLNLSNILEKDYLGALLGGLFFAFIGLPFLGMPRLPFFLGAVNLGVAVIFALHFKADIKKRGFIVLGMAFLILPAIFPFVKPLELWSEQKLYKDKIIYMEQSQYQKIVITQWHEYFWLYLDGHEQFSSYDEYRYHEALVHPAMLAAPSRENVLILGGGDGLAVREVLKYRDVKTITLVDVDPAVTRLATNYPLLVNLNEASLKNPKVKIVNDDGAHFLRTSKGDKFPLLWNVIIIDLPDPRKPSLERLYSVEFYRLCRSRLARAGIIVTQATSPIFCREAFWCIVKTIKAAGLNVVPYHAYVPTFGEWGWVMASELPRADLISRATQSGLINELHLKFLTKELLKSLFLFSPADEIDLDEIKVHSDFHPVLFRYYQQGTWIF